MERVFSAGEGSDLPSPGPDYYLTAFKITNFLFAAT